MVMEDLKKQSVKSENKEMEIPTTEIYKLKELQKYSKDFIRVLLPKSMYKPSDAIRIVKAYFKD